MKILVFSSLYPNAAQPVHGLFVERRLLQVVATGRVEARVVAPVPWFPLSSPRFGEYSTFARVPHSESRNGLEILHPRYPLPPKIGMSAAPLSMALSTLAAVRRLRRRVPLRAHRCPLLLSGWRRRGAARQVARRAGHDHGARNRHQPDPALPGAARMDTLGGASLRREHRRLRGAAQRDGRARHRRRAHPRVAQRRRSAALPAAGSRSRAHGARPHARSLAAQCRAADRAQGS